VESAGEVILVLKVAMNIAPVALYFIILGLVNSQSRVHVVSVRRDWLGLMLVFFPVLMWPVLWLSSAGWVLWAALALVFGVSVVFLAAPSKWSGWVVYNCDRERVRRELELALKGLGLGCQDGEDRLAVPDRGAELEISEFRLLRNVTVNVNGGDREFSDQVGRALERRMTGLETEPGFSAVGMLVSGTVLLILPLSMMVDHIDAFVKVVSDLIPV